MGLHVLYFDQCSVWVLRTQNAGQNLNFQHFFVLNLGIKHLTSILVQTKKNIFCQTICPKFVTFLHFLSFLSQKMLKMKISTSIWGLQHPNAGQNIQHLQSLLMASFKTIQIISAFAMGNTNSR